MLLEGQRSKILLTREEQCRLKSRAIWLRVGDENTKFFQNYARGRKNANTIWKLKDEEGREANYFENLSQMGISHFKKLFPRQAATSLAEVIRTTQSFPCYVDDEDVVELMGEVMKKEVENIIKSMARNKILGPDGWIVELFQQFFEQIG